VIDHSTYLQEQIQKRLEEGASENGTVTVTSSDEGSAQGLVVSSLPPNSPARGATQGYVPLDPLLDARESATEVGLSEPGFWKAVQGGRMPPPYYPLSRAPRWRRSELHAAVAATRALPADQKARRRAAKLARAAM